MSSAVPVDSSFTLLPSIQSTTTMPSCPSFPTDGDGGRRRNVSSSSSPSNNPLLPSRVVLRNSTVQQESQIKKQRFFRQYPYVRVSPFEPLVHHRGLPRNGTISTAAGIPRNYDTNVYPPSTHSMTPSSSYHNHYCASKTYSTKEEWLRAAFEPPMSRGEYYKRRCYQMHYAYSYRLRHLHEDQRQLRRRILELEDLLLQAQGKRSCTTGRQDDHESVASCATEKARSSPRWEGDLDNVRLGNRPTIPQNTLVPNSMPSSVSIKEDGDTEEKPMDTPPLTAEMVTTISEDQTDDDHEKPLSVVTVRTGQPKFYFTDSEALSEDEMEDEDENDLPVVPSNRKRSMPSDERNKEIMGSTGEKQRKLNRSTRLVPKGDTDRNALIPIEENTKLRGSVSPSDS